MPIVALLQSLDATRAGLSNRVVSARRPALITFAGMDMAISLSGQDDSTRN